MPKYNSMSFVSIRPSDLVTDQWYTIVLTEPNKFRPIIIPRKGEYVAYKAYFVNEYLTEQKIFDIVFPKARFWEAVKALPPWCTEDLTRPILIKFKYTRRRNIFIDKWEVI